MPALGPVRPPLARGPGADRRPLRQDRVQRFNINWNCFPFKTHPEAYELMRPRSPNSTVGATRLCSFSRIAVVPQGSYLVQGKG